MHQTYLFFCFVSAFCKAILDDIYDKTVKNLLVPEILPLVKNLTNITITWIRSWDPVSRIANVNFMTPIHLTYYITLRVPPPGGAHLREVWVGVCRRGLQTLTLFKTKSVHFATLFKRRDLYIWLCSAFFICLVFISHTESFF